MNGGWDALATGMVVVFGFLAGFLAPAIKRRIERPRQPKRARLGPGEFLITVSTIGGELIPQTVIAPSLSHALHAAGQLPLAAWFPAEDHELG